MRYFPFVTQRRSQLLYAKFIDAVRFNGSRNKILRHSKIIRNTGLVLGNDITIQGGGSINATAGILIGDRTTINKNILLSSVNNNGSYGPIIIGSGNVIDSDLKPGSIISNKIQVNGLSKYNGQIVFILSTGRSGSNAIAKLLDQHPDAECFHDSFPHIYSYAADVLYGRRTLEEVKSNMYSLYNSCDVGRFKVHGQSEQKLSALIPILAELFPKAKFIWLIRKADSFINSSYLRGWFANSEFGYPEPNPMEFYPKENTPSLFDARHRVNGFKCGAVSSEEWEAMTAFERNCWYWSYWNQKIETELSKIGADRSIMVRLNELSIKTKEIFEFVGLQKTEEIRQRKTNQAKNKKLTFEQWTKDMHLIYNKWCGQGMAKWFDK